MLSSNCAVPDPVSLPFPMPRASKIPPGPPPTPMPKPRNPTTKISARSTYETCTTRFLLPRRSKSTSVSLAGRSASLRLARGRSGRLRLGRARGLTRPTRGSHEASEDERELEEQQERRGLDQHRHRVGAGEQHLDDDQDQIGVAAIVGELLGRDDSESRHGDHAHRDLKDEPDREESRE